MTLPFFTFTIGRRRKCYGFDDTARGGLRVASRPGPCESPIRAGECPTSGNTINSHTHTGHTDRENTPDTGTHTRTTRKKEKKTNTSHKHLTTLEGGATTVRATSHARVGDRAEVSMRGRVEVRRGLGSARVELRVMMSRP